ncbi:MAG: hypothetical protein ACJ77A_09020 [Actinomycetota bacterium]
MTSELAIVAEQTAGYPFACTVTVTGWVSIGDGETLGSVAGWSAKAAVTNPPAATTSAITAATTLLLRFRRRRRTVTRSQLP